MNLEYIKTLSSRLGRKKQVQQVVAREGGHWIYNLDYVFFSYEEWYALNWHVNGQNNTQWYYENTHVVKDFLLYNLEVIVQYTLSACKIMVLMPF
jgi:hypothetical protein